jgi:protein transport protein SEC24
MQRVCIDIVVASSLVTPPPSPTTTSTVGIEAMHPNGREFLDVATLAELCRNTCGKFKWLRVGNECGVAVGDGRQPGGESFTCEQLREELKRSALAYSGSDVVFKLRCSSGVQVKSYCPTLPVGTLVGDGIVNSAELELSSMNSGASIALLLEHKIGGVQDTQGGRRGIDSPMVFFQSAVLYTTMTGRRRVRVSTMGLITTKVPADVYRSADLGTVAAIMTRQAISDLEDRNEGSLNKARTNVFQKCVEILANYRMHTTARTSPEGQLVLPESLQLLPLFCLSLRKSRLLRNSSIPFKRPFPSADERAYHIFYGRMATPYMSLQCVHPNLFQLSDMRSLDGEWIAPPALETNLYAGENAIAASMRRVCQLPKSMNPSIACLDEKGMYILDDRFAFYLFIGKEVPEEHWKELLSVSKPSGAHRVDGDWVRNVPMGSMAVASTESGPKLRNILRQLRALNSPNPTLAMCARHTHAPLILVFVGRGSVFEEEMDSLLVDDPDDHEKSYVDFLCDVHRALRQKMANT